MAQAKRIDYIERSAYRGELAPVCKFTVPQRKIDEATRSITFTISTAGRDRDGDIISQDGWDLKHFLENPMVLWSHDPSKPENVIARAESTKVINGKLISTAVFAEHPNADTIFQLYKGGFLNATSVGFVPSEMELIEGDKAGEIGFKFLKQNLLEYSAVAIPSNPEALIHARSMGINIDPCKEWIKRILDERSGGAYDDLLYRTHVALFSKLHPVQQADIADRNAAMLRNKQDALTSGMDEPVEAEPEVEEVERPTLATAPGGDETHSHELQQGEPQTEGAEDDGHIHAVNYDEDGAAVLEPAEGHSHDLPPTADVVVEEIAEEDEDEYEAAGVSTINMLVKDAEAFKKTQDFTDWPQAGMDLPVSLLTSEYRAFPVAEAKALQDDWPEIWSLGGCVDPETFASEDGIRAREEWAARHVDGYKLEDVVKQVRCLVRGSRGIEYMRLMLSHAKEHVMNERDMAKGLSPEEIDAITDRIVSKAVVPAIEKAFRQHSGRLS